MCSLHKLFDLDLWGLSLTLQDSLVLYSTSSMVKYIIQLNYGNNKANVIQLWKDGWESYLIILWVRSMGPEG